MSRPRIVVLDGYTLNPGDLSWEPLAALGNLELHERTPPEALLARASGAPILITNKAPIGAGALDALSELRFIAVTATGTNIVDRGAARARGIAVSNVPDYGADSVAEHTLGLLLEATKHLGLHTAAVRDGGWARQPDFSLSVAGIRLLAGRTLGIVGHGAIGRRVAELARAFKMNVLIAARSGAQPSTGAELPRLSLAELLPRSEFLSLHCPLAPETERIINAQSLRQLPRGAVLINTSRGGLVDELALADALRSGQLAGAYLDVLGSEPPPLDHPLIRLPNCWITPHVAWASLEARTRLLSVTVENVRAFLEGKPIHVVN
jgi:glycerate dehydrogenase